MSEVATGAQTNTATPQVARDREAEAAALYKSIISPDRSRWRTRGLNAKADETPVGEKKIRTRQFLWERSDGPKRVYGLSGDKRKRSLKGSGTKTNVRFLERVFQQIVQKHKGGREDSEFVRKLFNYQIGQKGTNAREDAEFIRKLSDIKTGQRGQGVLC